MRVKVEYRQASKENYNLFIEENTTIKVSYLDFQNIIYTFNYGFRDHLLETGEKAKLPWGFGEFTICKRRRKTTRINKEGKELSNRPINWKKTKELGKHIYYLNFHTSGYSFKWKWFANNSRRFKYAEIWVFKPSRFSSRLINHYLQEEENSQYKYLEWDL